MSGDYTGYFCAGNFNGATISKFAQKVRDEGTRHVDRALIANTDEAIIHLLNREAQIRAHGNVVDASQQPEQHLRNRYPRDVWIGDASS